MSAHGGKFQEPKNQGPKVSWVSVRFFGSLVLWFLLSKAFYRINDAIKHFELLVQSRDLQDLSVGDVAGGDLQIAVQCSQCFLGIQQSFQSAGIDRLAAIEVNDDIAPLLGSEKPLQLQRG